MRVMVALLTAAMLAGCSTQPVDDADPIEVTEEQIWAAPDWAIEALANQDGHDHYNWTHHAGRTTPNFEILGHDALATEHAGGTSGGYLCGEVGTDLEGRSIAVTQSHYDEVALVVADVTNATAPSVLAELVIEGFSTYDAAITDDARYALIAVSSGSATTLLDSVDARVGWRGGCESMGPIVKLLPQPSVLLVDLADPSAPVIVDQALFPGLGVHSVSEATIDGTYYVAASSVGGAAAASNFVFYTIDEDETLGATLGYYGSYNGANVQSRDASFAVTNSHTDATIQKHPKTGQLLAYLADWSGGMIVVELVERGVVDWQSTWGESLPVGVAGSESFAVHSTLPVDSLWDDRHITIVGEETITPRTGMPTGFVFVIDTTDPTAPEEVARWTLPSDIGGWSVELIYSPHYAAVINTTVFVSMYHGGVWAFDASPEHWPYPPTTGVFIPSEAPEGAAEPQGSWDVMGYAPILSEVVTKADGTLISFDSRGGVYTYRYEENPNVEPVESWFKTQG